jgi:hypothetical protein
MIKNYLSEKVQMVFDKIEGCSGLSAAMPGERLLKCGLGRRCDWQVVICSG